MPVDTGHPLRVAILIGTRPEAVKLSPVIAALRQRAHDVDLQVVVTAQHREMLDQVLLSFDIVPDLDLDLMASWAGRVPPLAELTREVLRALDGALEVVAPDVVVVQGDTTTAFAGGLAAFFRRIPVAHVEAGLRTYNSYDPFPEEMHRRLLADLATLHLCPTEAARNNLLREGICEANVIVSGNTGIDALRTIVDSGVLERLALPPELEWLAVSPIAGRPKRRLLLVTLHRRENWGEPIARICAALRRALDATPDLEILLPLHRNEAVRKTVVQHLQGHARAHLVEHLDYLHFLYALQRCYAVLTDSGGVQEEAPALGKPLLVVRETTERQEGVEAGVAQLIGTDEAAVFAAVRNVLTDPQRYAAMSRPASPYGDGAAAVRVVAAILRWGNALRQERVAPPSAEKSSADG